CLHAGVVAQHHAAVATTRDQLVVTGRDQRFQGLGQGMHARIMPAATRPHLCHVHEDTITVRFCHRLPQGTPMSPTHNPPRPRRPWLVVLAFVLVGIAFVLITGLLDGGKGVVPPALWLFPDWAHWWS